MLFQCCQSDPEILISAPVLTIMSGQNQPGENGEELVDPIIFMLTDIEGNPLENIQVNFSIIAGGGVVNHTLQKSDQTGFVEVYWKLGSGSHHILKASISGVTDPGVFQYVFAQVKVDMSVQWTANISFPWIFGERIMHDNRILETNHFLIYSDESSDDAKIRFAKIAEERMFEVFKAFNVQSGEELGIIESEQNTKLKLYSNVNTQFPYGGFAFRTGYVYYALDSDTYLHGSQGFKDIYELDIKHESVHTIQFLTGLDNLPNLWPDVWFSEGIAVFISKNRSPITTLSELNEWRNYTANDNPIKVHEWSDYPSQGRSYYQMFGMAVSYLLQESGHGKTTSDVLEMFRYMAESKDGFSAAFEEYMGMSLQYYEDNFWELITKYITSNENS